MSRTERVTRLRHALQTGVGRGGVRVVAKPEVDTCDVCVQSGSGLAFLRVVEPEQSVEDVWMRAQTQIDAYCDKEFRTRRPDLYLVLVSEGKLDPEDVALQAIASDPYVCRKLILEWADHPVENLLASLPFWPLRLPELTIGEPPSPTTVMGGLGYNQTWMDNLLGRPAPKKLAEQLVEGQIAITSGTATTGTAVEAAAVRPARQRGKITAAEVEGFRVFGDTTKLDLDANLVVVYGRNSTGKTSLCEAIEWGLLGEIERLKKPSADAPAEAEHPVLNLTTRNSRVKLVLDRHGAPHPVERWMALDGAKRCMIAGRSTPGDRDSILKAVEADLPENASPAEVRESFRRYHFLNQTALRDFLCDVPPKDRYQFLRPMLGTAGYGRARERAEAVQQLLAKQIESAKTELAASQEEFNRLETELAQGDSQVQSWMSGIGLGDPDHAVAEAHRLAVALGLTNDSQRPQGLGGVVTLSELLSANVPPLVESTRERVRSIAAVVPKIDLKRDLESRQVAQSGALATLHSECEQASANRTALAKAVQTATERLTRVRERLVVLQEARQRQEKLAVLEDEIRQAEARLAALPAQQEAEAGVQSLQRRVADLEAELASVREQLCDKRKTVAEAEQSLQQSVSIKEMLSVWLGADPKRAALRVRQTDAMAQHDSLVLSSEEAERDRTRLESELSIAHESLLRLGRSLSERNQLLLSLHAHIDSQVCPLCSHSWPDRATLLAAAEGASSVVPTELQRLEERHKELARELEGARARASECKVALASADKAVRDTRQHLEVLEAPSAQLSNSLRRFAGIQSVGPDALLTLDGLVSDAQGRHDSAQRDSEETEKRCGIVQIDLDGAREALAEQVKRRDVLALERRNLDQRISHLRAEASALHAQHPVAVQGGVDAVIAEEGTVHEELRIAIRHTESLKGELQSAENQEAEAADLEAKAIAALGQMDSQIEVVGRDLDRVGVDRDGGNLNAVMQSNNDRLRDLEELAALVPTVGTYARLMKVHEATDKTRKEHEVVSAKVASLKGDVERLEGLVASCDRFISDLCRVAKEEETRRLREYGPTINQIYQRLNRHPYFGDLMFEVNETDGEFKVQVGYNREKERKVAAVDYFSASQANVLALSVFLTSALLQNWSTLSTIILDDPVQHLDDLNTHSLLDLLQGLAALDRQVIVTTSNISLYKLMLLKYSHLNVARPRSFKAFRLRGIRHEGPEVFDDTAAAT